MILPFRVDVPIARFPAVTVAVVLLCNVVYWLQLNQNEQLVESQFEACQQLTDLQRTALAELDPRSGKCEEALAELYLSPDPDAMIREAKARASQGTGSQVWPEFVERTANGQLQRLRQLPQHKSVTGRLEYHPESWNPLTAVTAVFAHASVTHLLGNLYFFVLFGSAVEMLLGRVRYLLLIILVALGSQFCYSIVNLGTPALPTLGISGVIYGLLGMLAWALPRTSVRYAYWYLIRFGVLSMPALVVALGWVGVDAYVLYNHAQGAVNMVAHVSGAVLGALLAATLFRRQVANARASGMTVPAPGDRLVASPAVR